MKALVDDGMTEPERGAPSVPSPLDPRELQSGPQKVLMTADAVGGVWTYALDLVRALPEVEFALATMGRRLSESQWVDQTARRCPRTSRVT